MHTQTRTSAALSDTARPPLAGAVTETTERKALLNHLGNGRGVTDTLAALLQPQDTPADRVRRARLLREILQALDSGTITIRGLKPAKTSRFLTFLEREIAWLENLASRRDTPRQAPRSRHEQSAAGYDPVQQR